MPQILLIKLIYHVVLWLNAFPTKTGVGKILLPCKIMLHQKLDFVEHCQAVFSSNCKVQDEPTPTNTMVTQATPAIILGPMGNLQGTYKFYNLIPSSLARRTRGICSRPIQCPTWSSRKLKPLAQESKTALILLIATVPFLSGTIRLTLLRMRV